MLKADLLDPDLSFQVLLIGDCFEPSIFNLDKNAILSSDHNVNVHICSTPSEKFIQALIENSKILTVIVTDKNCVLDINSLIRETVFVISCNESSAANVYISSYPSQKSLVAAIKVGFDFLVNLFQISKLNDDINIVSQERKELSNIGIAMSAEKNLDKLLTMVLQEGRKLGKCEAASLYLLLNPKSENPQLLFKLTQNSKMKFDFKEKHFPLTNKSLAGYVALTGDIINIADAHKLSDELPYRFDKSFDEATGYRTRQMLVLPMTNHKGKIIGVLQFINNQDDSRIKGETTGFNEERKDLLSCLASQAAIAIDNNQLIDNIQALFEGFVAASVKAIESRDPVTSGHSFRVAEYTTGLALSLDAASSGLYKNVNFSKEQLREIRYASLLHDFGKVGVKEDVLLKANKLFDSRLKYIDLKIEWQKQLVQRKFYQTLLMGKKALLPHEWQQTDAYFQMQLMLEKLTGYQKVLMQANKPSLLDSEVAKELQQLFDFNLDESFPYGKSLLSQKDFLSLSVTRGSLTEEERDEIQSHVVHTQEFLLAIPWTDELSQVPYIAGSHHEKLDGSGYPCGIKEQDIPVASKIMAVADIYDALTARDRPYKSAVKTELALDILNSEAKNGKLCGTMVNTFIETKIYQKIHLD